MDSNNELLKKDFEDIKNNLSLHVSNEFLFREDQVRAYSGITFNNTDWSSKNMRRIHFSDCKFFDVNFRSVGFTGSIFRNSDFIGGILDFAIFDECLFINCNFNDSSMKASSFCKAEFVDCTMNQSQLDACFFTDVSFNGFVFHECQISDIIWENAKFSKCHFNNSTLQKLNFEFTYFIDIHFDHTSIPFASLPFVFGGLEYIFITKDEVFFKTIHPSYKNQMMSKKQYLELLPDLLMFYEKTSNFFPMANIYLSLGKMIEGITAIRNGLEFWFKLSNYKMMYYICDLTNTYNLSINDRKELYKTVEKCNSWILTNEKWDKQKRWNVQQYKMRECLLNSQSMPYVSLEFVTSINSDNYILIAEFMQTVETLLIPPSCYFSLELRHNSPFSLLYTIFADETTLFNAIVGIITILGVCDQLYSNHIKSKIEKTKVKNKLSQQEQETIKNKIEKNATNVNYNFYNCNINNLDMSHFMRQSIGCVNPESSGKSQ